MKHMKLIDTNLNKEVTLVKFNIIECKVEDDKGKEYKCKTENLIIKE